MKASPISNLILNYFSFVVLTMRRYNLVYTYPLSFLEEDSFSLSGQKNNFGLCLTKCQRHKKGSSKAKKVFLPTRLGLNQKRENWAAFLSFYIHSSWVLYWSKKGGALSKCGSIMTVTKCEWWLFIRITRVIRNYKFNYAKFLQTHFSLWQKRTQIL